MEDRTLVGKAGQWWTLEIWEVLISSFCVGIPSFLLELKNPFQFFWMVEVKISQMIRQYCKGQQHTNIVEVLLERQSRHRSLDIAFMACLQIWKQENKNKECSTGTRSTTIDLSCSRVLAEGYNIWRPWITENVVKKQHIIAKPGSVSCDALGLLKGVSSPV